MLITQSIQHTNLHQTRCMIYNTMLIHNTTSLLTQSNTLYDIQYNVNYTINTTSQLTQSNTLYDIHNVNYTINTTSLTSNTLYDIQYNVNYTINTTSLTYTVKHVV